MNGHQCWKIHRAVMLHFTSKYDLFQYNGRFLRDNESAFQRDRRRKFYEGISSKFEKPYMAVEYFLSNIIYSSSDESFGIKSWDNYKRWIKEKESLTKFILDDIEKLDLHHDLSDDNLPNLLKYIVSGKILPQTAVAINEVTPFLDEWQNKVYFGFEKNVLKLTKLKRFCKYNTEKVYSCIMEKQSEEHCEN